MESGRLTGASTRLPRDHTPYSLEIWASCNKDTPKVVWELWIRDLEGEGWNIAFSDGSGLDGKAAGGYYSRGLPELCHNP